MKRYEVLSARKHVSRSGLTMAVVSTIFGAVMLLTAVAYAMGAPATGGDPYIGTWINSHSVIRWKYEHTADGKLFAYWKRNPDQPTAEGRWQVVKKWRDGAGDYFYDIRATWSGVPYEEQASRIWYSTVRINASGTVMQSISNTGGFVDPTNDKLLWQTYTRQK